MNRAVRATLKRMTLREMVATFGEGLMDWGNRTTWKLDNVSTYPKFDGKRAVRFPSESALSDFLTDLSRFGTVITGEGDERSGGGWPAVARAQAEKTQHLRNSLSITIRPEDAPTVSVQFMNGNRNELLPPTVTAVGQNSSIVTDVLRSIETHTRVFTRADRLEGRRLVDPIDIATDLQTSTSRALSRRAAWFGAGAGFLASIAAQVLGAALRG